MGRSRPKLVPRRSDEAARSPASGTGANPTGNPTRFADTPRTQWGSDPLSRLLRLDPSSGQLFIRVDPARATVGAAIASTNGLLKTGTGELVLAGFNTISGRVRPVEGLLSLRNTQALAGSQLDMNLADGGIVTFALSGSRTYELGTVAFLVPGRQTYQIAGLTGSRNIEFGDNTLAVSSGTYSGVLSGVGGSITSAAQSLEPARG